MDEMETHADLLISLLVRFPQIGAVDYEPSENTLRLLFLIKQAQGDLADFPRLYRAHLSLFHKLRQEKPQLVTVKMFDKSELIVLKIKRDLASLSLQELNLTVQLIGDFCGLGLIQEVQDWEEEDQFEHNALIESLLSNRSRAGQERLTGFREKGRVLVFSTPLSGVTKQ